MKDLLVHLLIFGSLALGFFGMVAPALIISGGQKSDIIVKIYNSGVSIPLIGFLMSFIGLALLGKR